MAETEWKAGEVYGTGGTSWAVCVSASERGAALVDPLDLGSPFLIVGKRVLGSGFTRVPPSDATRAAVGLVLQHLWSRDR